MLVSYDLQRFPISTFDHEDADTLDMIEKEISEWENNHPSDANQRTAIMQLRNDITEMRRTGVPAKEIQRQCRERLNSINTASAKVNSQHQKYEKGKVSSMEKIANIRKRFGQCVSDHDLLAYYSEKGPGKTIAKLAEERVSPEVIDEGISNAASLIMLDLVKGSDGFTEKPLPPTTDLETLAPLFGVIGMATEVAIRDCVKEVYEPFIREQTFYQSYPNTWDGGTLEQNIRAGMIFINALSMLPRGVGYIIGEAISLVGRIHPSVEGAIVRTGQTIQNVFDHSTFGKNWIEGGERLKNFYYDAFSIPHKDTEYFLDSMDHIALSLISAGAVSLGKKLARGGQVTQAPIPTKVISGEPPLVIGNVTIPQSYLGSAELRHRSGIIVKDSSGTYMSLHIDGLYAKGQKNVLFKLAENLYKDAQRLNLDRLYLITEFRNPKLFSVMSKRYGMVPKEKIGKNTIYEIRVPH